MTPFLEKISTLKNHEQRVALTLLHLMNADGFVNLTWDQAYAVFNSKSKPRIRTVLAHMKQAGLCTGQTNSYVSIHFTCAHILREYAHILREYAHNSESGENPGAHIEREYAHIEREYAHFGGYRGKKERKKDFTSYLDPLIESKILNKDFLSFLLSEDQQRIYDMLVDDEIAMWHDHAHAVAQIVPMDRAAAIIAKWFGDIGTPNESPTLGLFARLVQRDEKGNYRFRAVPVPPAFYESDFARRHDLSAYDPLPAYAPVADSPDETEPEGQGIEQREGDAELWKAVLGRLSESLPAATFETRFTDTKLVGWEGSSAVICTPTTYAAKWINTNLRRQVSTALSMECNRQTSFEAIHMAQPLPQRAGVAPG